MTDKPVGLVLMNMLADKEKETAEQKFQNDVRKSNEAHH